MQRIQRGHVPEVNGPHRLVKACLVVSVGKQISMIQHLDPHLPIRKDLRRKRILQNLPWGEGRENDAGMFEVIFDGLPGQFEGALETPNRPLLFQGVECFRAGFQGTPEQGKGARKTLEALLPSNVVARTHGVQANRTPPLAAASSDPENPRRSARRPIAPPWLPRDPVASDCLGRHPDPSRRGTRSQPREPAPAPKPMHPLKVGSVRLFGR